MLVRGYKAFLVIGIGSLNHSATEPPMSTPEPHLQYTPSFAGRLARVVIPAMQAVLPLPVYRVVYDALYKSYKGGLRIGYGLWTLAAQISTDRVTALKRVFTFRLLRYSMGGRKALENAFEVVLLAEKRQIPGALVECGVAEGGTSAMMALTSKQFGRQPRQKWLFDSYEGLPEPTAEDYVDGKAGEFIRPLPKGACLGTVEQVGKLMFSTLGLPKEEINLVKGWFQDTVPNYRDKIGRIAVLRLDGDWYDSTKIPLENFYDSVAPGGFVIIDDYATCFGSRRAVDEFCAARGLKVALHPDGRGGVWFEKAR